MSEVPLSKREQNARNLARELLFQIERDGELYSLYRDADVSRPVIHQRLSLQEVEELLSIWKLRGFHGG